MTKRLEPQNCDTRMCGVGQEVPSNMKRMMQQMLAGWGPTLAEMMQEPSPREGGAGCGCGPMMERMLGECFKGGTSKAGEQD